MPSYQFIVLCRAVPGREEAFDRWYDDQHLADCLRVPGMTAARRYRIAASAAPLPDSHRFESLAIYEFESDDPDGFVTALRARAGSPEMPTSDALDRTSILSFVSQAA